jgi:hypothetical protein
MRVLTRAIWGLIFLVSATTAHADVKFGIAAEPYTPFTWKDASGKWVGWEIDLMNGVCEQMHENCQIVELSWDNIIPALNGHFIDVIWALMGITAERQRVIDFKWAFASDDWEVSAEENDLRVGGKFKVHMAAKDASAGFDWGYLQSPRRG